MCERERERKMKILNEMGKEKKMGRGKRKAYLGFGQKDIWTGRP